MRRLDIFNVGLCASLVISGGCTDAGLFRSGTALGAADRVTLSGRVCTRDNVRQQLPIKMVLVIDRADGPQYAAYDAPGARFDALRGFVQSALNRPAVSLAVVGFAGNAERLAPTEGSFTRNPGELISAIDTLSLSEPCNVSGRCRDTIEALRVAQGVIEDDLAQSPAGERVITQYVLMLVTSAPAEPLANNVDCCDPEDASCLGQTPTPDADCQNQLERESGARIRDAVERLEALGIRNHVMHLGALADPAIETPLQEHYERFAFDGGGSYQRFDNVAGVTGQAFDVLGTGVELRAKTLIVSNLNARPRNGAPAPDTDADGLSDAEEEAAGTLLNERDTDGDGLSDFVETVVALDPLTPDEVPVVCQGLDLERDTDLDGLYDCDEEILGTAPTLVDTDGDGLPDMAELIGLTDYLNPDANADTDGDGSLNGDEIRQRSDPRSADLQAQLDYGYRYRVDDEGVLRELTAEPIPRLSGVQIAAIDAGTTPGLADIRYRPDPPRLSFRDAQDDTFGPEIDISEGGEVALPSSSWAPLQEDQGRRLQLLVSVVDLPIAALDATFRIVFRERQCLSYTVRNIVLVGTQATGNSTETGRNRIVLFFGESPEGRLARPGPFRLAEVPVVFNPPASREPEDAIIEVDELEFLDSE